ncbi:MAG: hypothetical protein AVDCRST_MAG67-263 [uncultured Solirubrobacteraceae bacterium]|uniref:Uncharacterized protein n=1 Tax=uncultured Solirubrobacteraceae bacterium TaxID=1162706 RepID=A0A6J4RF40_9ACTN|nr:MAG: hypothetical protein AVDCRST_MAG67-263 [uncultured Solirubrobacteraceae bacterium]
MVGSWPDERYEQASESVALACLELLTDEPRWIHRRVETIDLLAQELVRRQVTVDFTLPAALLDDLRIGPDGPWCVPIAILEKRPLRNFDLREHDESRPILGASSGGPITAGIVTAAARLATAPDALEPEVASLLALIARSDLEDARGAMIELRARAARSSQIARVVGDDTSGYFLATFAESYMLIALLGDPSGRRILKYAYDEHLRFGGRASRARRLARRLGWSPFVVDVAVPTAAHAASYHAEVVVPEELRLDAWILDARSDELLSTDIERSVDRGSLHAPRVALDAEPLLVAAISPERADLPTLAFATSAVTTLLLLLGAAFGNLGSPTAGSSVALLLAGSVLFATAVARSGEHRLVRGIFAGPRWLLSIVAVAALAAAASVAFGAGDGLRDVIWYAAGGMSLLSCLSLAVGFFKAASLTRRHSRSGADEDP